MWTTAPTVDASRLARIAADSARVHAWMVTLVGVYGAFGLLISILIGRSGEAWPLLYVQFFLSKSFYLFLIYALARVLHAMVIVRPARLLEHLRRDFTANPDVHRQIAAGLPLVIFVPIFLSVFASLKVLIPEINPFGWDVAFADWDRWLHGGIDPWRILQPVLGYPVVTYFFDLVYSAWFYILQLVCIWQAFSVKRPRLRLQFFLSFLLIWVILGNLGATLFSSAGPCFFDAVVGRAGTFQPLMDYLREAGTHYPLWSSAMQETLWQGYLSPEVSITRGISAMPSIHVAMAFLLALLGWRVHRVLGVLLTIYLGLIMVGSVHLGWHYAIDGYAGIAGTYLIWRAVGWALARRDASLVVAATT